MKKTICIILMAIALLSTLCACGSYHCYDCGKTTTKAYYDYSATKEYVLCEDCARTYWMPLNYKTYRVK